jgi:hypothetical protein
MKRRDEKMESTSLNAILNKVSSKNTGPRQSCRPVLRLFAKYGALVSILTVGFGALQAREANALLLVEANSGGFVDISVTELVLCVIALPICLLDQKATPSTAYTSQDLRDNGYSNDQIARIEHDQTVVMTTLQARHRQMVIEPSDTRESLARGLRALDPRVSSDYIDFVADLNHLN